MKLYLACVNQDSKWSADLKAAITAIKDMRANQTELVVYESLQCYTTSLRSQPLALALLNEEGWANGIRDIPINRIRELQ